MPDSIMTVAEELSFETHIANVAGNPHGTTAAMVGAATTGALAAHTGDTGNPHAVTAAQAGAVAVGAAAGGDLAGAYPNPTVSQAHLPTAAAPAPPASGLVFQAFNHQGFPVAHVYDPQGNAIELTRDCLVMVRNESGSSMTKGQVVRVTGSTGAVPTVGLAQANTLATLPATGVLYENIANNAYGRMLVIGNLENINLSAFAAGDLLYVSATTAGALTATAPAHAQSIGTVLSNGVGNGILQVFTRVVQHASTQYYFDESTGDTNTTANKNTPATILRQDGGANLGFTIPAALAARTVYIDMGGSINQTDTGGGDLAWFWPVLVASTSGTLTGAPTSVYVQHIQTKGVNKRWKFQLVSGESAVVTFRWGSLFGDPLRANPSEPNYVSGWAVSATVVFS